MRYFNFIIELSHATISAAAGDVRVETSQLISDYCDLLGRLLNLYCFERRLADGLLDSKKTLALHIRSCKIS